MKKQGEVYLYLERYRGGRYPDQVISRAENALARHSVTSMDQLLEWNDANIGKPRNVGRGTKAFIRHATADYRREKALNRGIQEETDMDVTGVVLLVDSNDMLRRAYRELLGLVGHTVHAAASAEEARRLLKTLEPEVVLLDVDLQDSDGFDFCQELWENTDAEIILMSSGTEREDNIKSIVSGAAAYFIKPSFHPNDILRSVCWNIQHRRKWMEQNGNQIPKRDKLMDWREAIRGSTHE